MTNSVLREVYRKATSDTLSTLIWSFQKKNSSLSRHTKTLKFTGELAFVREVLYRRIVNHLKQTEIDNKSDAVHG